MKSLQILCLILTGVSFVSSFSWQLCGNKNDPVKIQSLDVYSNQSDIVYVTGRGKVAVNITSPVEGKVEMYKKFFWGWTLIPCVEKIGSCSYEDICSLSPFVEEPCPEKFKTDNLPCKCPIWQGQYSAKRFPIDLKMLPKFIESGRYKIKLALTQDTNELLCLIVDIKL